MMPFRTADFFQEASVFTPDALLREARRQKRLSNQPIPSICLLDPDGDIARSLRASGKATPHPEWPCYHTEMLRFDLDGFDVGLIPCAVGASYAVLVAEELFAAGCQLLISITSAGQLSNAFGPPPYFILIESAWRDEGTSHHYLPSSDTVSIAPEIGDVMRQAFRGQGNHVFGGSVWTTDAPFRETASAIAHFQKQGAVAVEMEAAALYAFAAARKKSVVCFAHVTNQMAARDGDFEKGQDNGAHEALEVVRTAVKAWAGNRETSLTDTPSGHH
jgi:uridine phosphorylase